MKLEEQALLLRTPQEGTCQSLSQDGVTPKFFSAPLWAGSAQVYPVLVFPMEPCEVSPEALMLHRACLQPPPLRPSLSQRTLCKQTWCPFSLSASYIFLC